MIECPSCHNSFEADFGMVSCPHCGKFVVLDVDGNIQEMVASPPPPVDDSAATVVYQSEQEEETIAPVQEEETITPVVEESEAVEWQVEEPEAEEVEAYEYEEVAEEEAIAPVQEEEEAVEWQAEEPESEEVEEAEEYEYEEIEEVEEPEEHEEVVAAESSPIVEGDDGREWAEASSDSNYAPEDLSEIEDFGNSEMSLGKDGQLLYDLRVSGIDSASIKKLVEENITDRRLALNTKGLLKGIEGGVLEIKRLNAIKTSILVNRLKSLPVSIHWKQNVITQVDIE